MKRNHWHKDYSNTKVPFVYFYIGYISLTQSNDNESPQRIEVLTNYR